MACCCFHWHCIHYASLLLPHNGLFVGWEKLPRRADERAWKWQEEKAGEEERHSLYKLGSFRIELPKLWLVLHYFPSWIHLSSSYGEVSFRTDMSNDAATRLLLSLCSSSFVLCEREDLSSVISSPSLIPQRPRIPAAPVSPADFWTWLAVASIPELKASWSLGSGLMLPTLGIVGGPFCHCVLANGMGKKAWVG